MALNNLGMGMTFSVRDMATGAISRIEGGLNSMRRTAEQAGQGLDRSFRSAMTGLNDPKTSAALKSTGTGMMAIGTAAGVSIGVATKQWGSFEQQMLNIQAVTSKTKDEMADLEQFALDVGASTKFSAQEVAAAMFEISVSGISATEEIKRMTEGVAALSEASGMDLPSSASLVVGSMKAFQIEAENSGYVADVFAKAMTMSSFKAEEFELAIGNVGSVANTVGQSLEQTTSGLMALRNANVAAADGATAMKSALLSLVSQSSEAEAMIDQLGIEIRDSQGQMKSWPDIVGEFERAFDNMEPMMNKFRNAASLTESELKDFAEANRLTMGQLDLMIKSSYQGEQAFKEQAMATVFGTAGIRAMATALSAEHKIMKDGVEVTLQGSEALKEWERELHNSSGTAREMADIMNSGINFAFEEMAGAADTAWIILGKRVAPGMIWLASTIQGLINVFNELPEPVQQVIAYGLMATAVLGVLGGGTMLLASQVPKMVKGAKSTWLAFKFMTSGAWSAIRGLTALTGRFILLTLQVTMNSLRAIFWAGVWLAKITVMGAVRAALLAWTAAQWALNVALNANPITWVILAIVALVAAFIWAWNNVDWFREGVIAAFNWIVDGAEKLYHGVVGWGAKALDWFAELPGKIMGFLRGLHDEAFRFGENFVKMIGDGIANGVHYVKDKVVGVADSIKNFLGFSSPTREGPGSTADRWMPNLVSMLADGLDSGARIVGFSAARVAQEAQDELDGIDFNPQGGGGGGGDRPRPQPVGGTPTPQRPIITPPLPAEPQPGGAPMPAGGVGGAIAGTPRTASAGAGGNQIIQLVVDGQVLAEILANITGEREARGGAF